MNNHSYKWIIKRDIPNKSGIYSLLNDGEVVYIGRSRDIYKRILEHAVIGEKMFNDLSYVFNSGIKNTFNDLDFDVLEVILIAKLKPKLNILFTDEWKYISTLPHESKKGLSFKFNTEEYENIISVMIKTLSKKRNNTIQIEVQNEMV